MKNLVVFLSGVFLVLGCASAVKEVRKEMNNFKCSKADFERIDAAIQKNLVIKGFSSSDSSVYNLFKDINATLAKECPRSLLKTCSPGSEENRTHDSISGPANTFGLRGGTELKTRYVRDEFGIRVPDYDVIYSVSISETQYKAGLACYLKNTQ